MPLRTFIRRMLPIVALTLLATACGAPSTTGIGATMPPASAPLHASALGATTNTTIAFPQQAPALGPQAYPAASFEGTLVLENDCLRVISSYDGSTIYTPLWPPNVTLHTDVDPVEVRNPDGRVVARVGEPVALGGAGSFSAEIFDNLRAPIPKNCLEPYWYAAPFSETDFAVAPTPLPTQPVPSGLDPNDALVQDAQMFAASEDIGLEEAVRRLRLQEPIGVLGAELERNESATFAGLWIHHQPEYRLVVAVRCGAVQPGAARSKHHTSRSGCARCQWHQSRSQS